jgi:hypothetical protein
MAKAKAPKEGKNSKSHIKARLEFLQRAAEYFQRVSNSPEQARVPTTGDANVVDSKAHELFTHQDASCDDAEYSSKVQRTSKKTLSNLSRISISHMRGGISEDTNSATDNSEAIPLQALRYSSASRSQLHA